MANGFFSRLVNLWRGFLGLFIGGLETRHPSAVYEIAISERKKQFENLKKSVAGVMLLRDRLSKRLVQKKQEFAQIEEEIDIAVDNDEDDVALVLIEKKDRLLVEIEDVGTDLEKARSEVEEAKKSLVSFKEKIEKLKEEKERMLALKATAEARIKIQEQLNGLSADADIQALERVRDHIMKLRNEADIAGEIRGSDLETKLRKIRESAGMSSTREQLEAIKKARAAKGPSKQARKGEKVKKKL